MTASKTNLHVEDLIKAGIFNIEDLEVNRSGRLSDKQKLKLYFGLISWLGIALLEAGVLAVFLTSGNLYTAFLGVLMIIVPIYFSLKEAKPFWDDIKNDGPKSISGTLYKKVKVKAGRNERKLSTAYCSIRVGGQVFSISPVTYDHIIDGDVYRVYYVANIRKVINIEPLS